MKYEVFARINQGDEIKHIGNVTAKSDKLAKMYAYNTFDEEDWDMLAVVREDDYLQVSNDPKPTVGVSTNE
ncbi:phenylacetic acid degradation PaaB family protein [Natronococcus occultus]|uniref:Phenylacetic acid degradation PaaB family protein n=1 Tax=Natronococcus occultus SP4 TaxID=694430 RepID=L0JXK4_9EURY|nr:phenylacetic acid degradation PaaB family protein [Natronococcus occultus]AGB36593.1 phenylacetic acid degradation PaaB family protein [Natronococcus occultus SP4]